MGRVTLRVDMPQEDIRTLEKYVSEKTHAPLSKHFEKFIQPWLNEIQQQSTRQMSKTKSGYPKKGRIKYEKSGKYYRYVVDIYGEGKSFSSKDKSFVENFKTEFELGDMSVTRFESLRNKFRSRTKKYHAPPVKYSHPNHIYWDKTQNSYYVAYDISNKRYCFASSIKNNADAEIIRDYVSHISDKIKLYEESKGHTPKSQYFLDRIANDLEYQEYLKTKE